MHNTYKVSMFCIYRKYRDKDILLYNSLKGINSVRIVKDGIHLMKYLDKNQEYEWHNNVEFMWLVNNGYLIKSNIDEKAIRETRKAQYLENNRLYLTIHLTRDCNFRCVYCSNSFAKESISEATQQGLLNFIRKNIHHYSGICVSWFGGEPLLAIEVIETMTEKIIEVCRKMKKPYFADITTNGYLLSDSNVLRLVNCKVREICITVDGTKDIHNKMRKMKNGEDTYDVIMDNLLSITKSKQKYPIKVVIRINLTKKSLYEFQYYYGELNKIFGKDKRFSLYIKLVKDWGGKGIEIIEGELITDSNRMFLYKQYASCLKNLKISGCFEQLEFGGMTCLAARRHSLVVYTDGMVGKCERKEAINSIGKVTDKGIVYDDEIREMWNGVAYRLEKRCDCCELSTLCFGGTCSRDKILGKHDLCESKFEEVYNLLDLYVLLNEYNDQISVKDKKR